MNIDRMEIKKVSIPLRTNFKHSSASYSSSLSILVTSISENGIHGYGEGCPRSFVTGESYESAVGFFDSYKESFSKLRDLEQIRRWVSENKDQVDMNPAAWCAVELSLLDLLAKYSHKTVEVLLDLPDIEGDFGYTAVLGVNSFSTTKKLFKLYLGMGFRDFKIKLSGDHLQDTQTLSLFRQVSIPDIRLRVDAKDKMEESRYVSIEPTYFICKSYTAYQPE